jgi:hypothetical protein
MCCYDVVTIKCFDVSFGHGAFSVAINKRYLQKTWYLGFCEPGAEL